MQNRGCCDEQVRLRESMTHGLAPFHEATPDDENILVDIEQPFCEPRSQLVGQPHLQSLRMRSAVGNRSMPYLISAIVTLLRYILPGS
jgi:hypothetical protein